MIPRMHRNCPLRSLTFKDPRTTICDRTRGGCGLKWVRLEWGTAVYGPRGELIERSNRSNPR